MLVSRGVSRRLAAAAAGLGGFLRSPTINSQQLLTAEVSRSCREPTSPAFQSFRHHHHQSSLLVEVASLIHDDVIDTADTRRGIASLIKVASLIHDDVIDTADTRRGIASLIKVASLIHDDVVDNDDVLDNDDA